MSEEYLSPEGLADYLGVSVSTVHHWRSKGAKTQGPPSFKIGRHVRYRRTDVEAWLAEQAEG
jgi:excisionase family DNA binding protein